MFELAGIPDHQIIIFPSDLISTELRGYSLHKAAAPFLDPQLETFDRIIVLDADMFSLANEETGLVPLMDLSLNKMPPDQISLLRGWITWTPPRDEYQFWYDHGSLGKGEWIDRASSYCGVSPERIEETMYPTDPSSALRPFHNGAYINLPMRILSDNPEFRDFISEVSGTMGNEEIALCVWSMKHYFKTGKYFPSYNLQDYFLHDNGEYFHLSYDLDRARWRMTERQVPRHSLMHLYEFNGIADYAYDWAKEIHASEAEAQEFADTVISGVNKIREAAPDV